MAKHASAVIAIAKAEVGYLEKATNESLDSKTANAGENNYTKYARDLDKISGFYNGKKNGFAWCDVFVDWVFVKAFGVDDAKKLLCQPNNSLGAGCAYSVNYYKQKGQFHANKPKVGDQIFFYNSAKTRVAHTGIVVKVDTKHVYTIEGNTNPSSGVIANGGGVYEKKYSLSNKRICGYGRPKYDSEVEKVVELKTIAEQMPVLRKGDWSLTVGALQALLTGYGYSCGISGVDNNFGTGTHSAVLKYQKAKNLEQDGIVGPATWSKLLGL